MTDNFDWMYEAIYEPPPLARSKPFPLTLRVFLYLMGIAVVIGGLIGVGMI
jgi:hypothetical protein